MKIDNFALTAHQTCPAKFDLRINQGWSVRRRSAALGAGGALHEGLAAWYRGHGLDAAIAAIEAAWPSEMPVDDYRTLSKTTGVMRDYARTYPAESFTVVGIGNADPMVEVSFTIETGLFLLCPEHLKRGVEGYCPICGRELEPIEYGGIFDTLIEASRQVYILEHKSTSRLGSDYFYQFKPNNQVTGYVWGARQLSGRPVGGAIINAIGVYKSQATKFERSITTRNDTDIIQWKRDVEAACHEIQYHRLTGYFPRRTAACQLYGSCEFHSVHVLSSDLEQIKRLENDYVRDPWDYERRDEGNNPA